MTGDHYRQLAAALLCLSGAALAVFITGQLDAWAMVTAAAGAGLGLLVARPRQRIGWLPVTLALLLLVGAGAALLPAGAQAPSWREASPDVVMLADSFAVMPQHHLFWWCTLAATIATSLALMAAPLDTRSLRFFLHAVASTAAAYAVVSIVQAQTDWEYPFSGGANFGLLPNRNHTATLLVVGSVISFGLMQWEVSRGHRLGAICSALWGAPSLAALLFFSTSRAGVVFLTLGLALWAIGAAGTAVKRRTVLGATAILIVFLFVLFVAGGSTVRDRLGRLWSDVMTMEAGQAGVAEVDFRQPVFRDTLRMIADAPLTGQGLGHFEFVFPQYREESRTTARVLHPESDWLMVAAESGVPSLLALMGLVAWYVARCWKGRSESGGLLRWTAASAIGAAVAHGIIDVPWHRPALGWFLLVVASVSVVPDVSSIRREKLWRSLQILLGIILLATAVYLGRAADSDRPPLAYRWAGYAAEMKNLLDAQRYDDGEFVAREAIRDFPLNYQAYYWRAAFLRMFEGTEREMIDDLDAAKFVEPVIPRIASELAQLWQGLDEKAEAEMMVHAVRRAQLIEQRRGGKLAFAQLENSLHAAQGRPGVQRALQSLVAGDPTLLAHWIRRADPQLVDDYLSGLGPTAVDFLERLPEDERLGVLDRWIASPAAQRAVEYMEARNAISKGTYSQQLANYYATAGDKARAVGIVAEAQGLTLGLPLTVGEFGSRLAALEAQGNTVSVRRLLMEATQEEKPEPEQLKVAVTWYAAAGDWEMAWKAASRLATATKNRQ